MLTPFGKELRKLRIDHGLTLIELSERIFLSAAQLSAIETGRRNVTSHSLVRFCQFFGLNKKEKERFKRLALESAKYIKIDLSKLNDGLRDKALDIYETQENNKSKANK